MEQEKEHAHDTGFISESLVQARVCVSCGAYVSARLLQQHVDFHDDRSHDHAPEQLALGL